MLTSIELVALSVPKLESELQGNSYPDEVLTEAMELESMGANRVTALEALAKAMDASEPEPEPEPEPEAVTAVYVAKGKAVTTKRGIVSAGQTVREKDFAGGAPAMLALIKRGLLESR